MPLKMYDTLPSPSTSDLDALELRLQIKLPPEYRAWLLQYNGGQPWPGNFRLRGKTRATENVSRFLAVHKDPECNFENEYVFWKLTTGRLPGELVPIAEDGCGNLVCLAFGGRDAGKVFFWDHEAETEPASFVNVHLITDSFDEFIDMLAQPALPPGK